MRFGPFTVQSTQRVLMEGDARIRLGSRAFDILLLLLERAGSFVAKDEIFQRVWPGTVVVEGNLPVHVNALRKALGDGRDGRRYIVTVPHRGYNFVEPVVRGRAEDAPSGMPFQALRMPDLGAPLHRIIGRDEAVDALGRQIRRHRLVTVVGAGGIGKTTVAVCVAAGAMAQAEPSPWTDVHFIDLAPTSCAQQVPCALAAVLGLSARVDDAMPNLLAFLHDKSLLLLLDNCEHVLDGAAEVAESLLRAAPGVRILATSREPLRADGERILRLQSLSLPPEAEDLNAEAATRYGAIELFVDRASASLDTYAFQDADARAVADVCRRLDGIPLAIELAAACVPILGVRGVAAALEGRFLQFGTGRRTALPRHRTLQAVLDWSHSLLTEHERSALARIAVFRGSFTLESAGAVASDAALAPTEVFEAVTGLAAKSLLAVDTSGDQAYFRLLEVTRVYAMMRLQESGELVATQRRHAGHMLELMRESEETWRDADISAWRRRYGRHVDDVRTAIHWAMSPAGGELELGIAITVRTALLLFQQSLADECRRLATAAMEALERAGGVDHRLEFELHLVLGLVLPHTHGRHPLGKRSIARTLAMAQEHGDARQLGLAFTANWISAYVHGDPRAMLDFAQRFETLTAGSTDAATTLLYDWMKAPTLHLLGDQRGARVCAERSLAETAAARSSLLSGAIIDRQVAMGTILARVLWLQGLSEQAEAVAAGTVERARREGEAVGLAYALAAAACPVALWSGRFEAARERVLLLLRHTAEHSLGSWRRYALAFESLLDWQQGGERGNPMLPVAFGVDQRITQFAELLATLHPTWAAEGTFARGDAGDAGWCQAELLRLRGEQARDAGEAEALFLCSLERARLDGTLSWELRTATSLARLWAGEGREHEALELLTSVLERLTEGRSALDVVRAVALRERLAA